MTSKGIVEVPIPVKTRLNAAKELLKRNPGDPLIKAQTEKAIAEAKLATAQAEEVDKIVDSSAKKFEKLSVDDLRKLAHIGDDIDVQP